jgi:hypothetical protein
MRWRLISKHRRVRSAAAAGDAAVGWWLSPGSATPLAIFLVRCIRLAEGWLSLLGLHLYLSSHEKKGEQNTVGSKIFFLSQDLHLFLFFVLGSKISEAASAEIVRFATVIPRIWMYHSHEPHTVCFL